MLVTGALIYFISLQMTMSVFVTNMASMIGIGVAVDYSLFILARYREEREAGREHATRRGPQALSTSGLAVSFSGLAVIISLAGLWMVDNQALRSMALGAMIVVAVSILDRDDAAAGADRAARRPGRCRAASSAGSIALRRATASTAAGRRRPAEPRRRRQPLLGALDRRG